MKKTIRMAGMVLPALAALALWAGPIQAQPAELVDVDRTGGTDVLTTFSDGGLVVTGEQGTGAIPLEGAGTRMMWYPAKAAFRVGHVTGTQWDDANVGGRSMAMGVGTVASGVASTAMGAFTVASGLRSTAMGSNASTNGHEGTFVYADNITDATFQATGPNQFLVRAVGGVGLGTNSPQTQLDVTRNVNGGAGDVGNHVAHLENLAISGGDVLIVQSGADQPGSGVNFVTFRSANGNIGAIQGNGSGGVELISGSGDFAEMLPRERPNEQIEAGDVVGLYGGEITKRTEGADRVMVVTDRALAVGNDPGEDARGGYERVALVGQVPVTTRGPVEEGDLLIASGAEDGTARAVPPSAYEPADDGPVVGRAWEAASGEGVHQVTAAVGLGSTTEVLAHRLSEQAEVLERQAETIESLRSESRELRRENAEQGDAVKALRSENQDLHERVRRLEVLVEQVVEPEGQEAPQR